MLPAASVGPTPTNVIGVSFLSLVRTVDPEVVGLLRTFAGVSELIFAATGTGVGGSGVGDGKRTIVGTGELTAVGNRVIVAVALGETTGNTTLTTTKSNIAHTNNTTAPMAKGIHSRRLKPPCLEGRVNF